MSDPIKITDPNRVPVTFVNDVAVSGFVNGNVNLSFVTAMFTGNAEGNVDPDYVVTSRLRMDLYCAQHLRDRLDAIIQANTKPTGVKEH
jgi:hypothetical protein